MSERPTPDEIFHDMRMVDRHEWTKIVATLSEHGYVIVHPDDVPWRVPAVLGYSDEVDARCEGWNDCRRHIFGDR